MMYGGSYKNAVSRYEELLERYGSNPLASNTLREDIQKSSGQRKTSASSSSGKTERSGRRKTSASSSSEETEENRTAQAGQNRINLPDSKTMAALRASANSAETAAGRYWDLLQGSGNNPGGLGSAWAATSAGGWGLTTRNGLITPTYNGKTGGAAIVEAARKERAEANQTQANRFVEGLLSAGDAEKNRAHWDARAAGSEAVIRSYEAGEDKYTREQYEAALDMLPEYQANAEAALPRSGLQRIGLGLKAAYNEFTGGVGMALDTILSALGTWDSETSQKDAESYAAYMQAQRQAVVDNYNEMVSYLDPNDPRDAETIRYLAEERDKQLGWIDNTEAAYTPAMQGRAEPGKKLADWSREHIGYPARVVTNAGQVQAAEAERGLGTVGQFLTRYGIAGTQMLLDTATGGGKAMIPMVARSFGMGAYEAEQAGGDINEMVYQGTKQAAIEYLSEKLFAGNPVYDEGGGIITDLGYEALYSALGKDGAEALLRSTAARVMELPADMLTEGLEEVISDVMNPVVDMAANAVDGGNRDTAMPTWGELGMDFAVGAALGGAGHAVNAMSGPVGNVINTMQQVGRQAGATPVNQSVPETVDMRTLNQMVEDQFAPKTEPEAAEPVRTEPAVPAQDQSAAQEARRAAAAAESGAAQEAQRDKQETNRITPDAVREYLAGSLESIDNSEVPRFLGETSGLVQQLENLGGTDAAGYHAIQDLILSAAEQESPEAARQYIIDTVRGNNYGNSTETGTDLSDGSGQRDAGAGAGVESAVIQPARAGAVADAGTGAAGAGAVPEGTWTSVREQGISTGTEDKNIRLRPEASWTEAMRSKAAEIMDRYGVNVKFADGPITVRNDVTGEVMTVAGVVEGDTFLVRADSKLNTPGQIADHETVHMDIRSDPALRQEIRDELNRQYGDAELMELMRRYASIYSFCYGEFDESMTADEMDALAEKYLEEIYADAYAGITRQRTSGQGAAKYSDIVQSVVNARRGQNGYGAGGMPGGVRYSIESTEDGRPYVKVEEDILEGVPESEWVTTVKRNLKNKFPNGVMLPSGTVLITAQSRNELTRSSSANALRRENSTAFSDKLRATNNIGEILLATQNWNGEALEHDRHDSIKEFARGNVLFSVGGNTYTAEVLVGTRADGSMLLYDIVGVTPLEKTETGRGNMVELDKEPSHRRTSDSSNIITDAERKSNPQFKTLNDMVAEKFAPRVREKTDRGPRYMVAGEKAATADVGTLDRAREMEREGADSESIRHATGWYKGYDGKWKFEFSDADMDVYLDGTAALRRIRPEYKQYLELLDKAMRGKETEGEYNELWRMDELYGSETERLQSVVEHGQATLDQIVDHPALFEAYPQLRNIRVRFDEGAPGEWGAYNNANHEITLDNKLKLTAFENRLKDTIVHEIQHAVQAIEGFARGANTDYWEDRMSTGELGTDTTPYQLYERTAGEIEARDTARRRTMTDEERENTRPDIDREDVVFAEGAGESAAIKYTTDNTPFVNVEEDVLAGITDANLRKRTARNVLAERFADGIQLPNDLVKINARARREWTDSNYARKLEKKDIETFLDKLRITANADEILKAARNWVDEAPLHARKDGIVEFARGDVLVRIGDNDYKADVLVGTMSDNSLTLFDVVDLTPTKIMEKPGALAVSSYETGVNRRLAPGDRENVSQTDSKSNPQFKTLNDMVAEKFAPQVREGSKPDGPMYSVDEEWEIADASERETAAREAAALADASGMDTKTLRRTLKQEQAALDVLRERFAGDKLTPEIREQIRQSEAFVEKAKAELKTRDSKTRAEKKEARERAEKRTKPVQAKRDLLDTVMDQFSVEGRKDGKAMMGRYFDQWFRDGAVNETEKQEAFNRLVDAGAIQLPADPLYDSIRSNLAGTRIYVPEGVKAEFGDSESWNRFRMQAMGQGIYLVNDQNEAYHIDNLYQELRGMFGQGVFAQDTDTTAMLREIVDLAQEGRGENVSLYEMMRRTEDAEGWTMEQQLDDLYRRFSDTVDRAMYAAGIEVQAAAAENARHIETEQKQRQRYYDSIAKAQEQRRETVKRQSEQRQLSELQQKTLRSLQWLSKNRNKAPAELQAQWDEVLSDLDIYAIHTANEMRWSEKHQATWQDLADMYQDAREHDPNFLPSEELQRIWDRVNLRKIGDMDVDALSDLYRAAVALRTEYYNRNNVINDEEHRLFSELYDAATEEIAKSGGKGRLGTWKPKAKALRGLAEGLGRLTDAEMLTPMNLLEMMGGWKKDGQFYSMARQLQAGERSRKGYIVEAERMLEDFTKTHEEWIRKADGQGKDAIWHEVQVPELLELNMGDKPIFGETKTVYMTPMQKVHMYLESKNAQNLRHMAGGRTFVDKELYSQGKSAEALAQGTTVRLAPETVKKLVSDLTEEERALASALERYYNEYASGRINQVSNVLVGFDKAMTSDYAPIFTDANYNKTEPGIFDMTAEGVGHMKGRKQYSKNPSYNISAIDAFERHVDQTSRYVGLAIPVRNMKTLVNWNGNGTSMKKEVSAKWGKEGVDYIQNLMTKLQSPERKTNSTLGRFGQKLVSNYISAVFGANPGIVFKQNASYISAAAVLGYDTMPTPAQLAKVDEETINKYTPELAYRKLGYATPEVAELKKNPSKMDTNKFTKFVLRGGAITWMDATTVKNIWPWAENYVRKHQPELSVGSEEYYNAVAEIYNEAVNVTQPMYDVMNRASIMDDDNALVRSLTLFKTVPMQEYNTLRRYSAEAKTGDKAAMKNAAGAWSSVILSTMALEGVAAMAAWLKNGLKYYRDDDDELTAESFAKEFGVNMAGDLAGLIPGGSLLFEHLAHKWGWSDYVSDFSIVGSEQINDIIDAVSGISGRFDQTVQDLRDLADNGGSLEEYLKRNGGDIAGDVHDFAVMLARYAGGLPAENIEKYLGGIMEKALPGFKARLDTLTDTPTKSDLSGIHGEELTSMVGLTLDVRGIEVDDGTAEELARLYEGGDKSVIPVDTPESFTVDEESVELTATQRQRYDNAYAGAICGTLDALVESDAYLDADDDGRVAMAEKLYSYAAQLAKQEAVGIDPNKWVLTGQEAVGDGVRLEDYIAVKALGGTRQIDIVEYIDGMDLSPSEKGKLLYYAVGTEAKQSLMQEEVDAGGSWGDAFDACAAEIRRNAKTNARDVVPRVTRLRPAPEAEELDYDPNDGRGYYKGLRLPG